MTDQLITRLENGLGHIILNRPEVLNALSYEMILKLDKTLIAWEQDPACRLIFIEGAGDRAFCAGGDVRAVAESGRQKADDQTALTARYFHAEYQMNGRIAALSKPYIAFISGITMGGGCGISAHGSQIIATERTVWAMPETAIGLFPDVGLAWHLARLPQEIGTYLALTGQRIGAGDLHALGLATHVIPHVQREALLQMLQDEDGLARLASLHDAPPARLPQRGDAIAACFRFDSVAEIITALEEQPADWANAALASLKTASPTSLKLTLAHLRRARTQSLPEVLATDYHLSQFCMRRPDFFTGIRARLIDKTGQPVWSPATLAAVSDAEIEAALTGEV